MTSIVFIRVTRTARCPLSSDQPTCEACRRLAVEENTKTESVAAAAEEAAGNTEEKATTRKRAGRRPAVKKTALDGSVSETKDAAVKAEKKPVKKREIKTEISVQYMGKDISDKVMIDLVKKDWKASRHKIGDIRTIELYVKTEENKVYYVINGKETGSVEI